MQQKLILQLSPFEAAHQPTIQRKIADALSKKYAAISGFHILKKSIDARSKNVLVNLTVNAFIDEPFLERILQKIEFKDVRNATKKVIIVGAGPAGLFAALKLLEAGIKPIVLERGKDVKKRRRDLALLNREGIVNPESNYCFGEGGAGTYSDGKLYTRSNKRGDIDRILQLFIQYGAPENILSDNHPHIGTNKLPKIITDMREAIIDHGGEVLFEQKVVDIKIHNGKVRAFHTECGGVYNGDAYILATGHSARDIFELLKNKNILIEAKPFALGVRVEHPQSYIDNVQYHTSSRSELLPPASYSLVEQVNGRGVFSFCMCPGGIIAPASTAPGEIVVNGWSPSKRNNPYANSGMVVTVTKEDALSATSHLKIPEDDPLLFMHFQKMVEQQCFESGGGHLNAPAQRMVDFTNKTISNTLNPNSYLPGLASRQLSEVLPPFIYEVLAKGFIAFGRKMKGYFTNDANVVATESRTSSPVRIPRDADSFQHPQCSNLYPCGEGAGYAGGIVSAAMDGENVATKIISTITRS